MNMAAYIHTTTAAARYCLRFAACQDIIAMMLLYFTLMFSFSRFSLFLIDALTLIARFATPPVCQPRRRRYVTQRRLSIPPRQPVSPYIDDGFR